MNTCNSFPEGICIILIKMWHAFLCCNTVVFHLQRWVPDGPDIGGGLEDNVKVVNKFFSIGSS